MTKKAYKKKLGVVLSKVDNGFVLIKGNEVFTVNEIGARIFDLCNGQNPVGIISEKLASVYDLNQLDIESDVRDYLAELISNDLIKVI